jgi:hypothetical protein
MGNVAIANKGDRLVLTLNRKAFGEDYLIALVKRLQLEELAQKSGFTDSVESIADELDQQWWDKNAEDFLKGVKK